MKESQKYGFDHFAPKDGKPDVSSGGPLPVGQTLEDQFEAVQNLEEFDALAKPNRDAILNIGSVTNAFNKKFRELTRSPKQDDVEIMHVTSSEDTLSPEYQKKTAKHYDTAA